MNAQISFLDCELSLIHIPLDLYATFLQPILQVLLPPSQRSHHAATDSDPETDLANLTIDSQHGFLNVSITPIECSIVCATPLATRLFLPIIRKLPPSTTSDPGRVSISSDTYAVFSVFSAGIDAGSRVVDLTSPLALAGIPIFFITTYYSDFILVPTRARASVVAALLARGFEFEEGADEGNSNTFKSPAAAAAAAANHARGLSKGSSTSTSPPGTPPPSNAEELQVRTFALLQKRRVVPYVESGLRLVQCSGRERGSASAQGLLHHHHHHRPSVTRLQTGNGHRPPSWVDTVDTKLYAGLVAALASQPRFLSVTLAQDDPLSLLVDRELLPVFGDALVGPSEAEAGLVPIFLDLLSLPIEATGIVSGVAGRLVQEMKVPEVAELSYLSTARAGAVILSSDEAARALEILKPLMVKQEEE